MYNSTHFNNKFFKELINLFFHQKSYFFLCITKNLNEPKYINNQHYNGVVPLIKGLINNLINAESAVSELENISNLTGFQNFNYRFEEYISKQDFKNPNHEKTKKLIASISLFVINELEFILQDSKAQESLSTYLESESSVIQNNRSDSHLSIVTNSTTLEQFFKDEILQVLKPVDKYNNLNLNEVDNDQFFHDWQRCSHKIKILAMMHGYDKIEAISDRMFRISNIHRASQIKPNNHTLEILLDGKLAIERSVFKKQKIENIFPILNNFDKYLHDVEELLLNDREKNKSIEEAESSHIINNDADNNVEDDNFKIPGEDDPDLLSLIQEIVESRSSVERKKLSKLTSVPGTNESPKIIEDKFLNEMHGIKLFTEETTLFFKLINSALKKLIKNSNNESALEDLELASFSLKSHAKKSGFEKLSYLPNAIEDIAIVTITKKLEMPPPILKTIAEAIVLLQTFTDDVSFQEKFKMNFHELNQYLNRLKLKNT